jgi:hypothetical protein
MREASMASKSRRALAKKEIEEHFAKLRYHYGSEGASWLMLMLNDYVDEHSLTVAQALFAVDLWARTSQLIYDEQGFERLRECQQLAMASSHPHAELRQMYLAMVSG